MATMWFASGSPLTAARRQSLLDIGRGIAEADAALARTTGLSSAHAQVVTLRLLAPRVEPAMQLLMRIWAVWREAAWALPASAPRVWRT